MVTLIVFLDAYLFLILGLLFLLSLPLILEIYKNKGLIKELIIDYLSEINNDLEEISPQSQ